MEAEVPISQRSEKERTEFNVENGVVEFISLDLDKTLYQVDPLYDITVQAQITKFVHVDGGDVAKLARWQSLYVRHGASAKRVLMNEFGYSFEDARVIVNKALAEVNVMDYVVRDSRLFYWMEQLLRMGYRLSLITSSPLERGLPILEHLGVPEGIFDFIIDGSVSKHSGEAFGLWMDAYGFSKDSIAQVREHFLHIGDSIKTDIIPAQRVGINTILVKGAPIEGEFDDVIQCNRLEDAILLLTRKSAEPIF